MKLTTALLSLALSAPALAGTAPVGQALTKVAPLSKAQLAACLRAKVIKTCGPRTPGRARTDVVIRDCGGRKVAAILTPGPNDAPMVRATTLVTAKPVQAGQPEVFEATGFSLWISGTHPMSDGRSLAGLDTSLLGGKKTIELACQ